MSAITKIPGRPPEIPTPCVPIHHLHYAEVHKLTSPSRKKRLVSPSLIGSPVECPSSAAMMTLAHAEAIPSLYESVASLTPPPLALPSAASPLLLC